jgi:Lon protease-like protein
MLVRSLEVGGRRALAGSYAWNLGPASDGRVLIELRGTRLHGVTAAVPQDALRDCPVPAPALEQLCRLDPCFALPVEDLVTEEINRELQFTLLRCKPHGRLFLEDLRGSIAMYTRLILVEPAAAEQESSAEIWRRYHELSDDWLNHLGIAK